MKILIAEDEPISRMILEGSLRDEGHEVISTEDGQKAWDILSRHHFPVVISDWEMPEMDGLELCKAVRKGSRDNYTYFILLTAHGGKENYLKGMAMGVDDFLTKPHDEDQLMARLHVAERILGLRQHMKRLEGLLPICGGCKKIRDENDQWRVLENYIGDRSEVVFSHSLCPECVMHFMNVGGAGQV